VDLAENFLSSRRGTIILGIGAAAIAAILLIVYLNRYRSSLNDSNQPVSVLVAKSLIEKGAPGNIIGLQRQFQVAQVPKHELAAGAITDPSTLRGLVATHDIYGGQQLTAADFGPVAPGSIQTNLTKSYRAISIPFDASHGLMGTLAPGDHVDVYVGISQLAAAGAQPVIKQLIQNALVLATPGAGATSGNVILRAQGPQAAALALAADNGKIWLVLRPASGAKNIKPGLMTMQRLLLGLGR
jgi:Flp pilus assembly protein CpaB